MPIDLPPPLPVQLQCTPKEVKAPDQYGFSAQADTHTDHDHSTYANAMKGPDLALWKTAMTEEFYSILQHSVGSLVDPPPGATTIGDMWIFSQKGDEHNSVVRHKAQWIVFWSHEIEGLDYSDPYASVGKTDSLPILLELAIQKKWIIQQFDVKTAFLHGTMEDTLYCQKVTGFEHPTQVCRVWLLNKSLYVSKQAARRWQQHLGKVIASFYIQLFSSGSAVYVSQDS